jgi:peptidoglycan/LPS O-acetylase OafA/YrhL
LPFQPKQGSQIFVRIFLRSAVRESFFYKGLSPAKILTSLKHRLLKLEALRGFAALYVLLHHVSSSYLGLKSSLAGFPFRFGQEAVLVFFLLSGFVIHYSFHFSPRQGFVDYLIKRTRRIYPIFIIALFLSLLTVLLSSDLLIWGDILRSYGGNMLMLQDHPGRPSPWFLPFCGNDPLWSLAYEWWFYMLYFPIVKYCPSRWQKVFVFSLAGIGIAFDSFFPNPPCHYLALLPIWWFGVEMAKEYLASGKITLRGQRAYLLLLLLPLVSYLALTLEWHYNGKPLFFIAYPLVDLRYFVSTLFLFLLALIWRRFDFSGHRIFSRPLIFIGTFSYALYVFHYPLISRLRLFGDNHLFYLDLFLRLLLAFALSFLVERYFQPWINRLTSPCADRLPFSP